MIVYLLPLCGANVLFHFNGCIRRSLMVLFECDSENSHNKNIKFSDLRSQNYEYMGINSEGRIADIIRVVWSNTRNF